ncbi:hypothetical protein [Actinocorallia longicatena]|uniref:DUF3592 domain-containing protein n=1 Tax=Actinocorallia longicatena TaxID=111803 RepID=A0ABP6Q9J8_9ACTN
MTRFLPRGRWARAALLTLSLVLAWICSGVTLALTHSWSWLVAAPFMAWIGWLPFQLCLATDRGEDERRTWPAWTAFPFALALIGTSYAVPGDWYLRTYGEATTGRVVSSSCLETESGCLYRYKLADPAGTLLKGTYDDTAEHEVGSEIRVTVDPGERVAPRLTEDLGTRFFETATAVCLAAWIAVAVAACATADRRKVRLVKG